MATIQISKDKRGQFRFTVKARNGETIATSESYTRKAKALATAKSLKMAGAKIVDLTVEAAARKPAKIAKKPAKKTAKKSANKPGRVASSSAQSAKKSKVTKPKPAKSKPVAKRSIASGSTSARRPARPVMRTVDTSAATIQPAEAPPLANERPPRLFTPVDGGSDVDSDDFDDIAVPAGADIVTPEQLGDGEHIADGIEPIGDEPDLDD